MFAEEKGEHDTESMLVCMDGCVWQETLVSPHVLQANSIPFNRVVQEPGEFIINFPGERYICLPPPGLADDVKHSI